MSNEIHVHNACFHTFIILHNIRQIFCGDLVFATGGSPHIGKIMPVAMPVQRLCIYKQRNKIKIKLRKPRNPHVQALIKNPKKSGAHKDKKKEQQKYLARKKYVKNEED